MKEYELSIIIAAYNAEQFISKLLGTIPHEDDIEVIVINDGSNDGTENAVNDFKISHKTAVRTINQPNAGVSAARNRGISEAGGLWLLFADADDWYDTVALTDLISRLRHLEPSVGVVAFGTNHIFCDRTEPHRVKDSTCDAGGFLSDGAFAEASWNYAFRKDLIDRYNVRFPEGVINTEDQNFNLKAIAASVKVASFDLVVYNYNNTNDFSASHKRHKKKWTEAPILSALDLVEFCKENHLAIGCVKGNVAHLLYQFFADRSSDITICERRKVYRPTYRRICEAIPSFKAYKKYLIPYYNMTLGMLLFRVHDFIRK